MTIYIAVIWTLVPMEAKMCENLDAVGVYIDGERAWSSKMTVKCKPTIKKKKKITAAIITIFGDF